MRYAGQELPLALAVVVVQAEVRVAVAHHEIVHVEQHVVRGNLRQHLVCQWYALCLVLYYHAWPALLVKQHRVASEPLWLYRFCPWIAHAKTVEPNIIEQRYKKNGRSRTPRSSDLKPFIFELRDSAAAFVERLTK